MSENSVTFIVNGFRRPQYLPEQLRSIEQQSVPTSDVLFWKNDPGDSYQEPWHDMEVEAGSAKANRNFGVWARFAFALLAKTKYICVLDDDTIPGTHWIENCLETVKQKPGLLGTRGVRFQPGAGYTISNEIGVFSPNVAIQEVDIVTHNWFFEREWLSAFWRELPPPGFERAGEDIHLCYTLQKYLGLSVYVPPHPPQELSMWGSHPVKALRYGNDSAAIWRNDGIRKMEEYLKIALEGGFQLMGSR